MRPDAGPATRALRALRFVGHASGAWGAAMLVAPRLDAGAHARLVERVAAHALHVLGVRLALRGVRPATGPVLVVANHVSWLDVYALNAVAGARYVAKAEVGTWPVAGAIARGFGTIFLRRGSFRDAARVKDRVAAALRAGQRVVVFPEGTTSDGAAVGRFHAALLQAAVDAGVPVQPVAIRYRGPDGRREPAAAFVGDTTFLASLRRVLRRPAITAELTVGPLLHPDGRTRRDLVRLAHGFVSLALVRPAARDRALRRAA